MSHSFLDVDAYSFILSNILKTGGDVRINKNYCVLSFIFSIHLKLLNLPGWWNLSTVWVMQMTGLAALWGAVHKLHCLPWFYRASVRSVRVCLQLCLRAALHTHCLLLSTYFCDQGSVLLMTVIFIWQKVRSCHIYLRTVFLCLPTTTEFQWNENMISFLFQNLNMVVWFTEVLLPSALQTAEPTVSTCGDGCGWWWMRHPDWRWQMNNKYIWSLINSNEKVLDLVKYVSCLLWHIWPS